eukprot:TRINITY_DN1726_c0_g1_i6.p1 TRINITY_DN1726_c0_g1~~TRINITY_DN1726_c0_g1_i6.p1  ORF type:complete len:309 (-),score=45.14 TRINITY_DN1726_c0_g1_i6:97-1023(-)
MLPEAEEMERKATHCAKIALKMYYQNLTVRDNPNLILIKEKVNLRCPLSCGIIRNPVRGIRCLTNHKQCFDGDIWSKCSILYCPICYRPIVSEEELIPDSVFQSLLVVHLGSNDQESIVEYPPSSVNSPANIPGVAPEEEFTTPKLPHLNLDRVGGTQSIIDLEDESFDALSTTDKSEPSMEEVDLNFEKKTPSAWIEIGFTDSDDDMNNGDVDTKSETEYNNDYNFPNHSQVTAEETFQVQAKKIPKESLLSHIGVLYDNLQGKLRSMIQEGETLLEGQSSLTLVLEIRADLSVLEGMFEKLYFVTF